MNYEFSETSVEILPREDLSSGTISCKTGKGCAPSDGGLFDVYLGRPPVQSFQDTDRTCEVSHGISSDAFSVHDRD